MGGGSGRPRILERCANLRRRRAGKRICGTSSLGGIVVAEGPGADSAIARAADRRHRVRRPHPARAGQPAGHACAASPSSTRCSAACGSRARCPTRSSSSSSTAASAPWSCASSTAARLPPSRCPAAAQALTLAALSPGLARVAARLGRLRQHRRERARSLQPGRAARARARLRAHRGPGDLPARLGRAGHDALRRRRRCRSRSWCACAARCRATRPDRTFRAGSRHPIGYVDSNPDGDDGAPLTDYDVIGSPEAGTGLFALAGRARTCASSASRRSSATATSARARCWSRRGCAASAMRC